MANVQKITPFLTFNQNAEEAVNFYLSVFERSRILQVTRCGDYGPGPKGTWLAASFEIEGQELAVLNYGPTCGFNEAFSLCVNCDSQEEVDRLWERLTEGGTPVQCGWLKDRYGLSWQIVPIILPKYLQDPDPLKAARVMQAMMQMVKLDIAKLEEAYKG